MKNKRILQKDIIRFAKDIGFHLVGFTTPEIDEKTREYFLNWIRKGKHAGLWYLANEKRLMLRFNPDKLMEGTKSIIVFGVSYKDALFGKPVSFHSGYISTYALRKDYHRVIKKKLNQVINFIKENEPRLHAKAFVDSAPVLERYFAYRAGLGFIGKNNFLINPVLGGLIFIGEIFVNIEFESTEPLNLGCGNCTLCVESCPTGALAPYEIDLNLCISYHTIENRDSLIPTEVSENMENMVFGCDKCALACPYNNRDLSNATPFFGEESFEILQGLELKELLAMDPQEFQEKFKGTPVKRTGYSAFIRNVIIAAYNSKDRKIVEVARQKCRASEDTLVRKTCLRLGLLD